MTADVLAFDLTVMCADGVQRAGVELKTTETTVTYTTPDGEELKGKTTVEKIEGGNFLAPLYIIEAAILQYRSQG
jgi:hypothetical protein